MHVSLQEDIATKLEDFILLSRIGSISRAEEFVAVVLEKHAAVFPVFAECTGYFLLCGQYQKVRHWIVQYSDNFANNPDRRTFVEALALMSTGKTTDMEAIADDVNSKWHWLFHPGESDLIQPMSVHLCELANCHLGRVTSNPESFMRKACLVVGEMLAKECLWEAVKVFEAVCEVAARHLMFESYSQIQVINESLRQAIGDDYYKPADTAEQIVLSVSLILPMLVATHAQLRFEMLTGISETSRKKRFRTGAHLMLVRARLRELWLICPAAQQESPMAESIELLEKRYTSLAAIRQGHFKQGLRPPLAVQESPHGGATEEQALSSDTPTVGGDPAGSSGRPVRKHTRPERAGREIVNEGISRLQPEQVKENPAIKGYWHSGKLHELLREFLEIPLDHHEQCATFCREKEAIWDADPEDLKNVARSALKDESGTESHVVDRAVQRYLMLSADWTPKIDGTSTKQDILDLLGFDEVRNSLDQRCRQIRKHLMTGSKLKQPNHTKLKPRRRFPSHRSKVSGSQSSQELPPSPPESLSDLDFDDIVSDVGRSVTMHAQAADNPYEGLTTTVGQQDVVVDLIKDSKQRAAYNTLRQDFKVPRGREEIEHVFAIGSVIAIFWHENFGETFPSKLNRHGPDLKRPPVGRFGPGFISYAHNNAMIFSHIRRFILVARRHGFSVGVPISTYSGQGVAKYPSLTRSELMAHAIVYGSERAPTTFAGEPEFKKDPIRIKEIDPGETISPASRIFYAKPCSIEHNLKVKYIGRVDRRDIPTLLHDFREELAKGDRY